MQSSDFSGLHARDDPYPRSHVVPVGEHVVVAQVIIALAGGATSVRAAVSRAAANRSLQRLHERLSVPLVAYWLPIKPSGRTFRAGVSVDDGGFLALGDRPGEFLLDADPLQFLQRLVQARAESVPGVKVAGRCFMPWMTPIVS